MKEDPCKGCIIQPVCTKSCGELLQYGYSIATNWCAEDYVRHQNYLNLRRDILNRRCDIRLNKKEIAI